MSASDEVLRATLADLSPIGETIGYLSGLYGELEPFLPADRAIMAWLGAASGRWPLPASCDTLEPGDILLVPSLTLRAVSETCGSSFADCLEGLDCLRRVVPKVASA